MDRYMELLLSIWQCSLFCTCDWVVWGALKLRYASNKCSLASFFHYQYGLISYLFQKILLCTPVASELQI